MKRDAIEELFDYTGWAWERLARVIEELPPDQFAEPVAGSGWPSLSACLSHVVSAYDGWINGEWGLRLGALAYPGEEALSSWTVMREYQRHCREAFHGALSVDDAVLYQKRAMDFGDDSPELLSRADILANLLLHERGHHGDLNTLFHQLGIRSYIFDYRFFVSRREEFAVDTSG
ncbi:MAG: DinB family protein [Chloroflexi bacterium]|nr:DinB family protein [Chloroflexota bacterium]